MSKKSKILQILFGIIAAAGIWLSLWFSGEYNELNNQSNFFIDYLFLIVFVLTFLIRRVVEKKYDTNLAKFMKTYLISLCVGAGIFILYVVLNKI